LPILNLPSAYVDSLGFDVIDERGRMILDPVRWPSSRSGKGFTEVTNKVHSIGLKFRIHVMRGISMQAVNAKTPILDTAMVCSFYSLAFICWFSMFCIKPFSTQDWWETLSLVLKLLVRASSFKLFTFAFIKISKKWS